MEVIFMTIENKNIGFGITGSFCTYEKIIGYIEELVDLGANVLPIFSFNAYNNDTRFGKAEDFIKKVEEITGNEIIKTIQDAEPIGPKNLTDIMVIAPMTGNSLAKLSKAITDTPVLMAIKSHLRNNKPVVLGISTNDGLGSNAKNIGELINMKDMFFVPFKQDNPEGKPKSLVANWEKMIPAIEEALDGKQIQPILD
jgi:dipicolinate synthase subunit B